MTELTAREWFTSRGARVENDVVAAKVDGVLFDLLTPLPEGAVTVTPIRATDPEALEVIRHSAAHIMADAVQRLFPGTQVTIGPAIENGFYYDFARPEGAFHDSELEKIEAVMAEIAKKDLPFTREVMPREEVKALLEKMGERYKVEILEGLQGPISVYRHGDWLDLCRGPHVPSTRFLGAVKLTHVAGAYWRGDERNAMLARIYGTAFATREALDAHIKQLAEAKERDHRKLGKELELIAFHPWAPASPFFLPRGASIYASLVDYVRDLYRIQGYDEVVTPQIFDTELFKTSGHIPTYSENMYFAMTEEDFVDVESGKSSIRDAVRYGVKPMNCPAHCLMFGMGKRSYRELPVRMADFGRLHRYERSGVVQGMTRVRTFAQDDAHIFCTMEQIQDEISRFLDLVYRVYKDFGFTDVNVAIATRPEKRLGSDEMWDLSESALIAAVKEKNIPFHILEGEGAFYGAKIEFHLKDALGRPWQLGTMQVDFNNPERFDLNYIGTDNSQHRPVMLHRAVLGSIERFFAVLIEHVGGSFPTWLAPEQVTLITVNEKFDEYALEVEALLKKSGIRVNKDLSKDKLGAKIRNARMMRVPYLAVIGQKEVDGRSLSVRSRDENKELGAIGLGDFVARLVSESTAPSFRETLDKPE